MLKISSLLFLMGFLLSACAAQTDTRNPASNTEFADEDHEGYAYADEAADGSDDALHNRHDSIFNGQPVSASEQIAKATFQLALVSSKTNFYHAACTATLIDRDILLTAGHCVRDASKDLGFTIKYFPKGSGRMGKKIPVVQHVLHPQYQLKELAGVGNFSENDIALVRIARPIPGAVPALLPSADFKIPAFGITMLSAGFGMNGRALSNEEMLKEPGIKPLLEKVNNPNITEEERDQIFAKALEMMSQKPLLKSNVKAKLVKYAYLSKPMLDITSSSTYVCGGDSGGPTYLSGKAGLVVMGVHSTANYGECDQTQKFFNKRLGNDTFVPFYLDWIKSTVRKMKAERGI